MKFITLWCGGGGGCRVGVLSLLVGVMSLMTTADLLLAMNSDKYPLFDEKLDFFS